ncbi:MAG TPA: type II secretion system ATPase GspE [Candidatus Margulisiibacteriota bacterium]|nr:type II secretion system ATPase GspE [Candidatus Margulisiibacteriota bacterium]
MAVAARSLEAFLVEEGGVSEETLEKARERQRDGKALGDVLQEMGAIDPKRWAEALAKHFGLPFSERLPEDGDVLELINQLPINFAKRCLLLPVARDGNTVLVATADPASLGPLDDVRLLLRMPIRVMVAPGPVIVDAINRVYDMASGSASELMDGLDEERLDLMATDLEEPRDLLESDDEAPIIRLVNSLLFQAAKDRASDIHIEPFERDLTVRFRIDGILYDIISPPKRFQPVIISRVKIMAGLNIAEKRLPQDGRIRIRLAGKDIDIRVSIVPTSFGERVVMRLLDKATTVLQLEELGLAGMKLDLVHKLIKQSHGILLVTGPTGSGKTTTLYAALSKINTSDKNIITIEDPVEYQLHGIGQIQVNPKIELTFASGLRSILRQDPDVIMVGEIRDLETAEIAIQAALTGHLVFSTLHTNDSFGSITRLLDMGIEPFLVSSSVIAVMAQRLVRRLCPSCRAPYQPTREELEELGITPQRMLGKTVYKPGEGCAQCKRTGYRGRTGIHELLVVDDEVRTLIMKSADAATIRRAATARGMNTLREDGADKVVEGLTSIEEILRVTQEDLV